MSNCTIVEPFTTSKIYVHNMSSPNYRVEITFTNNTNATNYVTVTPSWEGFKTEVKQQ
jgi:hypothetical protein